MGIRSTNSTVVFSTQSTTSFLNKLDVYKTETLLLNLCNKIYFRQADERAAKLAESDLGKSEVFQKQSYGYSHIAVEMLHSAWTRIIKTHHHQLFIAIKEC